MTRNIALRSLFYLALLALASLLLTLQLRLRRGR